MAANHHRFLNLKTGQSLISWQVPELGSLRQKYRSTHSPQRGTQPQAQKLTAGQEIPDTARLDGWATYPVPGIVPGPLIAILQERLEEKGLRGMPHRFSENPFLKRNRLE